MKHSPRLPLGIAAAAARVVAPGQTGCTPDQGGG